MSHELLRLLPPVGDVLAAAALDAVIREQGRAVVVGWVRTALEELRESLTSNASPTERDSLLNTAIGNVLALAEAAEQSQFGRIINATGVVLHTSLGRAPLADTARLAVAEVAAACNLEVDLSTGERRERGHQLQAAWKSLTGAEAALVVNNNAAATLLALRGLCAGREVLISRGQLIEIGGSFRLPDVFAESGAILKEVGTTNRTRLADYEQAVTPQTAAILRVHPSNYRVVGFSETPETDELCALAHRHGLLYLDDIGSGCLVDTQTFGLPLEPTFQASLAAGADMVLGSGDKLLGGPQCGVLLGREPLINALRRHPLARALRIDKLTLAALSATLSIYQRGNELSEIPTLAMLSASLESLRLRAEQVVQRAMPPGVLSLRIAEDQALVGGGALPGTELPTIVLEVMHAHCSPDELSRRLRLGTPRVSPSIRRDVVCLDFRSILPNDDGDLAATLVSVAS